MSYVKAVFGVSPIKEDNPQQTTKDLVRWINAELTKLEDELKTPELRGIQFEILHAVPERYKEGDLYYFAAGIPTVNGGPGLFIRDSNSWRKL